MSSTAFVPSEPLTLGVEEELMLLDGRTLSQAPLGPELVREAEGLELPGLLKTELFACIVEANTEPRASAAGALEALREVRGAAAALAAGRGLALAAAGSHPSDDPEAQAIAPEPRYADFVRFAGVTARRQGVQGLHVHVGMPDEESCLRVLEGLLPWLPVVLAASANSPYLSGRATGMASNRAEVLAQLPRSGAPPTFATWRDWERYVERIVALGLAADYTAVWWDARPHPRLGTLEIRMPDQPTRIARSGAFVALLQALCATLLAAEPAPFDAEARALYAENRWAAARFGPAARLVDPEGERLVPAPELLDRLVELVRPEARRLGSEALLAPLAERGCDGDEQLADGAGGDLRAVCAGIVERSVASGD